MGQVSSHFAGMPLSMGQETQIAHLWHFSSLVPPQDRQIVLFQKGSNLPEAAGQLGYLGSCKQFRTYTHHARSETWQGSLSIYWRVTLSAWNDLDQQ